MKKGVKDLGLNKDDMKYMLFQIPIYKFEIFYLLFIILLI